MDSKSAENTHNMNENTNTLHNLELNLKKQQLPQYFKEHYHISSKLP